jgi:TolB-like protein
MNTKAKLLFLVVAWLLSACAVEKETYTPMQYDSGSRVAVWDLEDMSVADNPMLSDMRDFMTAAIIETLAENGGFEVIERQKLLLALEELSLGSSALVNEDNRLALGRILGAQLMVFGGYQLFGEQVRVDVRMVEVESGAVIKSAEHTTSAADLEGWLKAAEEAALKLL